MTHLPSIARAARSDGCSDIGRILTSTLSMLRIRLIASNGRTERLSNAVSIRLPKLWPLSSPAPLKRYSNIIELIDGSVINWLMQLRVSPQAIPPWQ
ncbi:Uncharacterised protein [Vibrio cholerae]|nr:Uncharacterised protein [Vibrio cholerae]CSI76270.1 Uncharacterised protein [Vibrio cholerae]